MCCNRLKGSFSLAVGITAGLLIAKVRTTAVRPNVVCRCTQSIKVHNRTILQVTINTLSAYEVKNNCCLFERLLKVKKNGVFLFGISFFVLEILTFLYYANEESDDVIGGSTKTAQHSIEYNSRNIEAVFFKLGTSNVHHKRMTEWHLLCCCHGNTLGSSLFLWKTKYPPFATFKSGPVGLARSTHGSHIVLTLSIRLVGVDDHCLR